MLYPNRTFIDHIFNQGLISQVTLSEIWECSESQVSRDIAHLTISIKKSILLTKVLGYTYSSIYTNETGSQDHVMRSIDKDDPQFKINNIYSELIRIYKTQKAMADAVGINPQKLSRLKANDMDYFLEYYDIKEFARLISHTHSQYIALYVTNCGDCPFSDKAMDEVISVSAHQSMMAEQKESFMDREKKIRQAAAEDLRDKQLAHEKEIEELNGTINQHQLLTDIEKSYQARYNALLKEIKNIKVRLDNGILEAEGNPEAIEELCKSVCSDLNKLTTIRS